MTSYYGDKHKVFGMDLIASRVAPADESNFIIGIPDDRKYYEIFFQMIHKNSNSFGRMQLNSVSGPNYSYYSANKISHTTTSITSGNHVAHGGNIGAAGVLTGKITIQKMQGFDALHYFMDTQYDNTSSATLLPDTNHDYSGRVNTLRNLDEIEMFANNGNIGLGSYIDVYGSHSKI